MSTQWEGELVPAEPERPFKAQIMIDPDLREELERRALAGDGSVSTAGYRLIRRGLAAEAAERAATQHPAA